ncbi:MAG: ABC transporter permease [Phaeodactylibacter sp.]|nr:ABC transporter permease [Phaeodactylibacter sp.]MCB9051594.1 ABC transporter permease [Lewinellaceae bacterium]
MWRNYLNTAIRNLWKQKYYTLINVLGLALGLACFLFILAYIKDELSYDQYHDKAGRIYRVDFEGTVFGQEFELSEVGDPFGPTVLAEFPEVEQQVRLRDRGTFLVRRQDNSFREDHVIFADSTFFDVFSFALLKGDPKSVLAEPNTLVITPAVAKKYFAGKDPIGQTLILDNDYTYRVTGLMEEMPSNTHFHYDMIASLSSLEESRINQWVSNNFHTYLVLREGADPAALQAKFPTLVETYIARQLQQFLGITLEDFYKAGNQVEYSLLPMTDIHLHSDKFDELAPNSDIRYVYIFSFIGAFILLLACINFMNLATARSGNRAREVGLRKVVGAQRQQLIGQFLSESVLLSFIALLLAVMLMQLSLPYFNQLSGKQLNLWQADAGWLWGAMVGLSLLVGILAGSYPAFFLSAFRPVQVLKGLLNRGRGGSVFRNALVAFQFAITIGLIVGSMVIYKQLRFIQNKKLGFNKEQVLILNDAYALGNNALPFKEAVLQLPEVKSATFSGFLPTPSSRSSTSVFLGRNSRPENTHVLQVWWVDHDYINTLDMEMVMGRDFSREHASDSSSVILNEAAMKVFNLENPLGQEISRLDGDNGEILLTYKVIGVVKDFHFASLRDKIEPLMLVIGNSPGHLAMKVETTDISKLRPALLREWEHFAPNQPFDFDFMDDDFNAMYDSEVRIGRIVSLFTFLAVFIACLGLLGLAAYTAERRTKEIGIRKVLGAPAQSLFLLLAKEFTRWVIVASFIALPVAYLAMQNWLQGFEYRVQIDGGTLFLASFTALLAALLTVSYHALRAVSRNPVEALRYE